MDIRDFRLFLQVNGLLSSAGVELETDLESRDASCNEIQIAGPAVNRHCAQRINYYLKDFFQMPAKDGRPGFSVGGKFYNAEESDWAVLIKIIDKSYLPSKTIHLLFGVRFGGTVAAVDYFTNHYSSIYRQNKSRPYIGVFAANERGEKTGPVEWRKIEVQDSASAMSRTSGH